MFYRLYRDPDARRKGLNFATIGSQTELDLAWRLGRRFDRPIDAPIRCQLSTRGGSDLPDAFPSERIPLFSEELIAALRTAGVDNLDAYPTATVDANGSEIAKKYFAVNIVGLIGCVDMQKSRIEPTSRAPMLDLRELVVNEAAARGARMFRLAENPSFILVTESVKNMIERANLSNVQALALTDRRAY